VKVLSLPVRDPDTGSARDVLQFCAMVQPARPLRVTHVISNLLGGGAETMVRGLCVGLRAEGIEASIISVYNSDLDAGQKARLGVPVVEVARAGRADLSFIPRLMRAMRELRPDVVHAHLHSGKYAGRIAALAAGVPAIVFTEHGDEAGGLLRRTVNRVLHPRTTRFIVFTSAERERYARVEGIPLERIVVIPNGIEHVPPSGTADRAAVRAALKIPQDAFVFVLPARMREQKNQVLAIDALAFGVAQGFPWYLVLTGTGADEDRLRAAVAAAQLESRVRFLGFRSDLPDLYEAVDVYLMMSLWERMPLAMGEAMMAGLPVLTTPWEGSADFVTAGETGFVCADWSIDAAFAAMREAYEDPVRRAAIGGRGRTYARSAFDISRSVRRHEELYRSLSPVPAALGSRALHPNS
jgi:glycosyltransferase involved in cell wall biosynthesis